MNDQPPKTCRNSRTLLHTSAACSALVAQDGQTGIEGSGSKPRPWLPFSQAAPSGAEKLGRAEDESRWGSESELDPAAPRRWALASTSKIGGVEDGLRTIAAKNGALPYGGDCEVVSRDMGGLEGWNWKRGNFVCSDGLQRKPPDRPASSARSRTSGRV